MNIKRGYIRVSTKQQAEHGISLAQQNDALVRAGVSPVNIYADEGVSGSTTSRPGLDALLKASQPGDSVVVYELSRLGRDSIHIQSVVEDLAKKDIAVESIREPIFNGADPGLTRVMVALLASINQMERERISQRTKDALALRKARGEKLGAPALPDSPSKVSKVKQARAYREKGMSYAEIGRLMGVTSPTAMRWCKREDI